MNTAEVQQDCSIDSIRHDGVISRIEGDRIFIRIISQSACVSCQAKSVCNVSDMREETIEVVHTNGRTYKVGEQVQLAMQKSLGTKAVFLGYILPCLIVLATLILMIGITGNEGLSGIVALAVLIPYYLILNLFKNRLKRTFNFRIV